MTTTATGLLESRLLRDLPSETLEAIERRLVVRRYPASAPILERGAGGGDVLFILQGRIRVVADSPAGREVILAEIGCGGLVGEFAAVGGGPRSASVVAATDCLVGSLDAATFRSLLARHPEVSLRLMAALAAPVRAADLEILEFVTTGAVARLCALRLEEARRDPSGRLVVDPLPTQEVLAGEIGATRETVAQIMMELAQAGLVRRLRRLRASDRHGKAGADGRPDRKRTLSRRLAPTASCHEAANVVGIVCLGGRGWACQQCRQPHFLSGLCSSGSARNGT
jgi:CRP-like cAMP-binding protein